MQFIHFIKTELQAIPRLLLENRQEAVVITTATLLMVIEYYYTILSEWFSEFLLYAVIPILIIILILKRSPRDFGLGFGRPRIWIFHVITFCLISWLTLFLVSDNADLQQYYDRSGFNFVTYFFTAFASLFGSEFLFRGFLLFGLKEKFGTASIFIQMVPFVLVHLGKPDLETLSTIVTGLYFGYICYRGKSFWPAFIVHMFINVFFLSVVNLG